MSARYTQQRRSLACCSPSAASSIPTVSEHHTSPSVPAPKQHPYNQQTDHLCKDLCLLYIIWTVIDRISLEVLFGNGRTFKKWGPAVGLQVIGGRGPLFPSLIAL